MPTLDWLDREQAMQHADAVPYRLLESVDSYGDPNAGNLLIQGDNLEALKALLPFYRGRVKCIFIDPVLSNNSNEARDRLPAWVQFRRCSRFC